MSQDAAGTVVADTGDSTTTEFALGRTHPNVTPTTHPSTTADRTVPAVGARTSGQGHHGPPGSLRWTDDYFAPDHREVVRMWCEANDWPAHVAAIDRWTELEAVIERGLRSFVEVGNALREIRDTHLYIISGQWTTFEGYIEEKLGISRAQAYRLIDAARVACWMSPIGDIANESIARQLWRLRDDRPAMEKVWSMAVASGTKVTAATVGRMVAVYLGSRAESPSTTITAPGRLRQHLAAIVGDVMRAANDAEALERVRELDEDGEFRQRVLAAAIRLAGIASLLGPYDVNVTVDEQTDRPAPRTRRQRRLDRRAARYAVTTRKDPNADDAHLSDDPVLTTS